jgi:S1-C subfamily serine protease
VSKQLGCKIVEGSSLYTSIRDAVVMISVKSSTKSWQGTGFFVSEDGYIVTAAHVITESVDEKNQKGAIRPASDIYVLVSPKYEVYKCRVVGIDGVGDIGVLKIEMDDPFNTNNTPIKIQKYLPFLESSKTGELAYVLGYPLGTDLSSFSMGIVRNERFVAPSLFIPFNVVLITSPAYQGNSGSPIVNINGEVIGLLTFVYYANEQTFESIGGGPSSSIVSYVAEKLISADKIKKSGGPVPAYFSSDSLKFRKGYLGFQNSKVVWFSDIPTLTTKYNFPHNTPIGFRGNLTFNSPLKDVLSNKDIIIRIDGHDIGALPNQTAPGDILWRKIPGDIVRIEYYPFYSDSYGPLKTISVKLLEYPDSVDTFEGRALRVDMDCIGDECSLAHSSHPNDVFYIQESKHSGF